MTFPLKEPRPDDFRYDIVRTIEHPRYPYSAVRIVHRYREDSVGDTLIVESIQRTPGPDGEIREHVFPSRIMRAIIREVAAALVEGDEKIEQRHMNRAMAKSKRVAPLSPATQHRIEKAR